MSKTKVEIRIKKVHCGNTEDVTGGDELYFTSLLTDGSAANTQAEIVDVIPINDNETKYPNALIYSAAVPNDRSIRGGIEAFDEDSSKDWSEKPQWIEDLKKAASEKLDDESEDTLVVAAALILDWGYAVIGTVMRADKDDKLGREQLDIPATGAKKQNISWRFSRKGGLFGYSSWNYTVDLEILRTPVPAGRDEPASPPLKLADYTIQQKSNGRFLDAHLSSGNDFSVVTRSAQNNDTQRWRLTPVGNAYTIQQVSNGRFLDAHLSSGNDFSVVTRPAQNDDTQRWVVQSVGHNTFTIQQLMNGRFVDAHESASRDYSVVTRGPQKNDTQQWIIKRA